MHWTLTSFVPMPTALYVKLRIVQLLELLKQSLPYLTVIGSVVAFCFTVFKYLHLQRKRTKNNKFEQYRVIFEWVAGRTAAGKPLVDTQQAMAVYQTSEFPEYKAMSLPIISYYLGQSKSEADSSLFRSALLFNRAKLDANV